MRRYEDVKPVESSPRFCTCSPGYILVVNETLLLLLFSPSGLCRGVAVRLWKDLKTPKRDLDE